MSDGQLGSENGRRWPVVELVVITVSLIVMTMVAGMMMAEFEEMGLFWVAFALAGSVTFVGAMGALIGTMVVVFGQMADYVLSWGGVDAE